MDARAQPTGAGRAGRFHRYRRSASVIMAGSCLALAEKGLVPLKPFWYVSYADDRPCPFQ